MGGTDDVLAKLIKKTLTSALSLSSSLTSATVDCNLSLVRRTWLIKSGPLTASQLLQPGRVWCRRGPADSGADRRSDWLPRCVSQLDSIARAAAGLARRDRELRCCGAALRDLIEFKLTIPPGSCSCRSRCGTAPSRQSVYWAMLCRRVKVLVLAIIVGIGSGIFNEFPCRSAPEPSLNAALEFAGVAGIARLGNFRTGNRNRTRFRRTTAWCWCGRRHRDRCGGTRRRRRRSSRRWRAPHRPRRWGSGRFRRFAVVARARGLRRRQSRVRSHRPARSTSWRCKRRARWHRQRYASRTTGELNGRGCGG